MNQNLNNTVSKKPNFSDGESVSLYIPSSWNKVDKKYVNEFSTQTDSNLYEFIEMETQTGMGTVLLQDEVSAKREGLSLIEYLVAMTKKRYSIPELQGYIRHGFIQVDDEVCMNSELRLEKDSFVELLLVAHDSSTQTESVEGRDINVLDGPSSNKLANFLQTKLRMIENELDMNSTSKAFENYKINSLDSTGGGVSDEVRYWKTLSVDLEKHKVTYPDWSSAKHARGKIVHVNITRTKQRVYDIDYDDGSRLKNVREEYIRIIEDQKLINDRKSKGKIAAIRFQEGVRVHTRISSKNDDVKFLPGRIIHVSRGGGYEVEVEGGKTITGLTIDDMMIGIDEGQVIEALKPNKIELQAMDMSWNATGSSVVVCYGRDDITGWCNLPGAVVIWNIFGASSTDNHHQSEPDLVLDHGTCLMSIACHPEYPSIIAAGSFNGEVVIWDLNTPEQPVAISPITEYTHKEPLMHMTWIYDNITKTWLLSTIGADGRVLFWDYMTTNLAYPVRGSLLNKASSSGRTIRQYPSTHGGTAIAFTSSAITSKNTSSSSSSNWSIIGQEGGNIIRVPITRFFETASSASSYLTKESFKSLPSCDDLYPAIKRSTDTFLYDAHIGSINAIHCSALTRNIFLSAGADGSIKLFHMLEKAPLKQWDPMSTTSSSSGTFSPMMDVKFSPTRPSVFATCSADGFLYIYDLSSSTSSPVITLEAISPYDISPSSSSTVKTSRTSSSSRVGLTSLAFNHRQRDLIAACDRHGRIHIWRLSWKIANRQDKDAATMDIITRHQATDHQ